MKSSGQKWWLLLLFCGISFITFSQETPISKSETEQLKKEKADDLWYADQPLPEKKTVEYRKPFEFPAWVSAVFKVLAWAVLATVLLLLAYLILKEIRFMRGENNNVIGVDIDIETEEELQRINFETSIRQAVEKEEFRLAIRYYYLWLIQQLSEQKLIEFKKQKTNRDYLNELKKVTTLTVQKTENFQICTRLYEYVWFGNFEVTRERFQEIEKQFLSNLTVTGNE